MSVYYFRTAEGAINGPCSGAQLKALAAKGVLHEGCAVRQGENGKWVPAASVRGITLQSHVTQDVPEAPEAFSASEEEPEPEYEIPDFTPQPTATTEATPVAAAPILAPQPVKAVTRASWNANYPWLVILSRVHHFIGWATLVFGTLAAGGAAAWTMVSSKSEFVLFLAFAELMMGLGGAVLIAVPFLTIAELLKLATDVELRLREQIELLRPMTRPPDSDAGEQQ